MPHVHAQFSPSRTFMRLFLRPSFVSLSLSYRERERRQRRRDYEIKEDSVRFCARVQRLPRWSWRRNIYYIDRKGGPEELEVGIVQGGVRARVVERQIVRHLTHLIPYLTPSSVTTLIHPFLRYAFLHSDPLTPFSPILPLILPLHRPFPPPFPPPLSLTSSASLVRPFSRQPPLRRRHQSFRLPTPYKRSCCPFITTTPATTTTERPTAPTSFPTLPFILHCFPPFIPSSCLLPSSTRTAWRISFISSFYSQTPPRSLLTL